MKKFTIMGLMAVLITAVFVFSACGQSAEALGEFFESEGYTVELAAAEEVTEDMSAVFGDLPEWAQELKFINAMTNITGGMMASKAATATEAKQNLMVIYFRDAKSAEHLCVLMEIMALMGGVITGEPSEYSDEQTYFVKQKGSVLVMGTKEASDLAFARV